MYATSVVSSQAEYLRMGVVQISLTNFLVIVVMIIVFILALVLPFPHGDRESEAQDVQH